MQHVGCLLHAAAPGGGHHGSHGTRADAMVGVYLLRPQGAYIVQKRGGKCQSGTLNH